EHEVAERDSATPGLPKCCCDRNAALLQVAHAVASAIPRAMLDAVLEKPYNLGIALRAWAQLPAGVFDGVATPQELAALATQVTALDITAAAPIQDDAPPPSVREGLHHLAPTTASSSTFMEAYDALIQGSLHAL
ncbi:hypothetical protein H9P43_008387, partial [Blastocladiella emersonii ATCC 22665]